MNQHQVNTSTGMEDDVDLRDYFITILDARWFVLAMLLLGGVLGKFVGWQITPVYQNNALIQIEDNRSSSIGALEGFSDVMGKGMPTEAEIEIIRSRSILSKVIDQLNLDVVAQPLRFPVVGKALARGDSDVSLLLAGVVDQKYSWGAESIALGDFDVDDRYYGKRFYLQADGHEGGVLFDAAMNLIGEVKVGQNNVFDGVNLFIQNLHGQKGKLFYIKKMHKNNAIAWLQGKLKISEKGHRTGLLSLSFEGENPKQGKMILDAIANAYVRQNVERKSAEAQQSIEFLAAQLPQVKGRMDAAESELNEYRLKHGSIDLKMEAQSILDQVVGVENAIAELDIKIEEIRARYTSNHPAMKTMLSKRMRLLKQKEELLSHIKGLPETEQQILRMTRDAKVASELYTFLLNKHQELKVVQAGTVGNVRVIDFANIPLYPIRPNKSRIMLMAMMGMLMLAVLLVFVRKAFHRAIEFPDELEQKCGLPVYAAVPHSDAQHAVAEKMEKSKRPDHAQVLAFIAPDDQAVEAMRSLRTSMHFALLEAKNNLVMITGPGPGIGKSFLSINFAAVLNQSGQRVLLIDGDMRKGRINRYIGCDRSPGLSEVISGVSMLGEAVHALGDGGLHVLTSGRYPPNPSELLLNENFTKLMEEVSYMYDIVVIDTPPVLAVTDPVIVGRHCGTAFLLVRAGHHEAREIEQSVDTLKRSGVDVNGAVFNDIPQREGYYKYGTHYHYQYQYKDTAKKEKSGEVSDV